MLNKASGQRKRSKLSKDHELTLTKFVSCASCAKPSEQFFRIKHQCCPVDED